MNKAQTKPYAGAALATSVMSFPDRGPWGDSRWRGNASGHVYRELFEKLSPKVFCDPMVGSGTSVQVSQEMGIEAYGLDLHQGFNAISMSILDRVGKPSDLVVSHPPYGGMVKYSGAGCMWGDKPHPGDLSHCVDDADFHEKMQAVLLNQRRATKGGGYYGCLIGDWRRAGVYTSYQAELIARMPSDELAAVIVKVQHNVVSDSRQYAAMKLPRIMHEYLLLWEKKSTCAVALLSRMVNDQAARVSGTWKNVVRTVLMSLGGAAPLERLYEAIAAGAPEKLATNTHWRDRVRATLNSTPDLFKPVERGVWALA